MRFQHIRLDCIAQKQGAPHGTDLPAASVFAKIDTFMGPKRFLNGCKQIIDLIFGRMAYVDDRIGPEGDDAVLAAAGAGPTMIAGMAAYGAEIAV